MLQASSPRITVRGLEAFSGCVNPSRADSLNTETLNEGTKMKVVAIALAVVVGLIALVGGGVAFWVFSTSIPSSVAVKPASGPTPPKPPSKVAPEVARLLASQSIHPMRCA